MLNSTVLFIYWFFALFIYLFIHLFIIIIIIIIIYYLSFISIGLFEKSPTTD